MRLCCALPASPCSILMWGCDLPLKTAIAEEGVKKEKLWKSPAVFTYDLPLPLPPSLNLHLTFLSFPSPRWANPWLSPAEKSRSLIIPTERVAKANLARGNGDPAPFLNLPISSLSFCLSVCVRLKMAVWPPGLQHNSSHWFPLPVFLPLSVVMCSCKRTVSVISMFRPMLEH